MTDNALALPHPSGGKLSDRSLSLALFEQASNGALNGSSDDFLSDAVRQAAALEAYGDHWSALARMAETILGERIRASHYERGDQGNVRKFANISKDDRARFGLLADARTHLEPIYRHHAEAGSRITRDAAITEAQRWKREANPAADPSLILVDPTAQDWISKDGRAVLLAGDFQTRLADLPDASVDLIVTDPPYPTESLPLWLDLAEMAARVLGPRGLLFAWSGQIHLPQVMAHLDEHLQYGWIFALHMPHGLNSRIMGRHIIQSWKPVLAYSPGPWPSGEWGADVLMSPKAEKDRHRWQQTAAPAQRLIERYSPPDGLVIDPFTGTGTFGWAARQAGRRFIGCEPDAGRFAQTARRLS